MSGIRGDLTVRRVDAEVDGDGGDALVGARQPVRLCLNLQTDLVKVHELAAFAVQELCVFYRRERRRSVNKGSWDWEGL